MVWCSGTTLQSIILELFNERVACSQTDATSHGEAKFFLVQLALVRENSSVYYKVEEVHYVCRRQVHAVWDGASFNQSLFYLMEDFVDRETGKESHYIMKYLGFIIWQDYVLYFVNQVLGIFQILLCFTNSGVDETEML